MTFLTATNEVFGSICIWTTKSNDLQWPRKLGKFFRHLTFQHTALQNDQIKLNSLHYACTIGAEGSTWMGFPITTLYQKRRMPSDWQIEWNSLPGLTERSSGYFLMPNGKYQKTKRRFVSVVLSKFGTRWQRKDFSPGKVPVRDKALGGGGVQMEFWGLSRHWTAAVANFHGEKNGSCGSERNLLNSPLFRHSSME